MQAIIRQIREAISETDFAGKTFIAGGFVRDQVMGITTSDLDITVELPQGGIRLAEFLFSLGLASKPVIYHEFGTALALMGNQRIEFVMTRNESYRKGSRKPVTGSGTIFEDICRRDFTINSLIMDIMTGEILDLSGQGLADIKQGIIRTTSESDLIFKDDPLRILRAVRFANRFQFVIEEKTGKEMIKDRSELDNISWERKRDEFEKILLSKTPASGLKLLYEFGLMEYLIPELVPSKNSLYYDSLNSLPALIEPRLAIMLAVVFLGENRLQTISEILSRLKLSSKISDNVFLLLRFLEGIITILNSEAKDDINLRYFYFFHKKQFSEFLSWLEIHFSCLGRQNDFYLIKDLSSRITSELEGKYYPLSGTFLKEYLMIPESPEIGQWLKCGLEIWLRKPDFSASELLSVIKEKFRS
jgi:tRNA nucleotidyltransferase/poly(A) polymerase